MRVQFKYLNITIYYGSINISDKFKHFLLENKKFSYTVYKTLKQYIPVTNKDRWLKNVLLDIYLKEHEIYSRIEINMYDKKNKHAIVVLKEEVSNVVL